MKSIVDGDHSDSRDTGSQQGSDNASIWSAISSSESILGGCLRDGHNPEGRRLNRNGAFGSCRLDSDESGRAVWVKKLNEKYIHDTAAMATIKREYDIIRLISAHDNIRKCYEYGEDADGIPYIELELLPGYYELSTVLANKSPLSLKIENRIITQLLDVVEYMHNPGQDMKEVTHGDLKPSNIMINPAKDFSLKVIDFGLAHVEGEPVIPSGTTGYSAPEQFRDNKFGLSPKKDILTDIYSVGRIMLDINSDRYREIAEKASSEKRGDRYQSIRELRNAYLELYGYLMARTEWDAESCKRGFIKAYSLNEHDAKRNLRMQVYEHSVSVVNSGGYDYGENFVKINDSKALRTSIPYNKEFAAGIVGSESDTLVLDVLNDDLLAVAAEMVGKNYRPAVLCACNRQSPKTAGGQEGNMLRRTDLAYFTYPLENSGVYPLDRNWGGIYSKGVTVFRGEEEDGYPLLEKPFNIDVVSVPAINKPKLLNGRLTPACVKGTANKVRTILRIAKINGNDSLVLTAFGCGNYDNPPEDIAEIFKNILAEEEFKSSFKKVVFAIKEDWKSQARNGNRGGNYGIFRHIIIDN